MRMGRGCRVQCAVWRRCCFRAAGRVRRGCLFRRLSWAARWSMEWSCLEAVATGGLAGAGGCAACGAEAWCAVRGARCVLRDVRCDDGSCRLEHKFPTEL